VRPDVHPPEHDEEHARRDHRPPGGGDARRDDGTHRGREEDMAGREARPGGRDVGTAQDRPDLARPWPLAHREVGGHLPAHDPLGDQLEHHREDHADGDRDVADEHRDRQPDGGADDEVAELHGHPQQWMQPARQAVERVEDRHLPPADRGTPGHRR
jgi:hypothetical protein